MFKHTPLCEVCRTNVATALVGFDRNSDGRVARWQFTCPQERADDEVESFAISNFLAGPEATIDRLAHLHQSGRIDWPAFMDMIVRLREATSRTSR